MLYVVYINFYLYSFFFKKNYKIFENDEEKQKKTTTKYVYSSIQNITSFLSLKFLIFKTIPKAAPVEFSMHSCQKFLNV